MDTHGSSPGVGKGGDHAGMPQGRSPGPGLGSRCFYCATVGYEGVGPVGTAPITNTPGLIQCVCVVLSFYHIYSFV